MISMIANHRWIQTNQSASHNYFLRHFSVHEVCRPFPNEIPEPDPQAHGFKLKNLTFEQFWFQVFLEEKFLQQRQLKGKSEIRSAIEESSRMIQFLAQKLTQFLRLF